MAMNSQITGLKVAGALFGLLGLVQLTRLVLRFDVAIAGYHVPFWASGLAVVVLGGLSVWLFRLAQIPR